MRLGELCVKIGSGATPKGGKESYKNDGIPFIRSQNVLDWSFSKTGLAYIDEKQASALANVEVKPCDVLLNITGDSVARSCVVPSWCTPARVNQHVAILRPDTNLNPIFLQCFLQSIKPALLKLASSGATRNALTKRMIESLDIEIPPIETQCAIVSIIEVIQRKIALNHRINDYLSELLLALQKQTEETEDLAESRADELFNIHIGKTPPRKEPEWFSFDRTDNVIWMSIKDMGSGDVYLIDSSEYLTPEAVEKHNVKKCSPGSILLSFKLTVGRVGIAANEMVTNEAIACFSSDDPRKLAYLYPLLKSYDYASLGSTSSIATAVNSRMIKAMTIQMPSSSALDVYYEQVKPIYDLLLDNAIEIAALAELRDCLLPKLMSGEIDASGVDPTQLNNHLCAG